MIPYTTFVKEAYDNVLIPAYSEEERKIFVVYTLGWTAFYLLFHFSVVFILKMKSVGPWRESIGSTKVEELPGYVTALTHHIVISPTCLFVIARDYIAYNSSGGLPFRQEHFTSLYIPSGLYPFTFAYFIADLIVFALPEATKPGLSSKIFFVHHMVALSMLYATLTLAQGSLSQVFPGMMCTEFSTVFFNLAWILRACGKRDWKIVGVFERLFAFFFLALRNCHLTLLTYVLWLDIERFGGYQFSIVVSTALQFFWGFKIIMSLFSRKRKVKKV